MESNWETTSKEAVELGSKFYYRNRSEGYGKHLLDFEFTRVRIPI
jgi:hypothetical protein